MRRLRRSIGTGAALTLLLLGAPASPTAAQEAPSATEQAGQGDEQRADEVLERQRNRPQPPRSSGTPAHAAATVACGQTITKDTTLTADIGPCQGEGIIVGADNIRLNLNGRRLLGNSDQGASGEFAGIRLAGRTGVTVTGHPGASGKKGTVSGFEAGVVIDGGSANTIENLTARDNIGRDDFRNADLGDGIVVFGSPSNRILNNVVVHNGIFDGIGVLGSASNNTTIQGNTVEDTVGPRPDPRSGFDMGGPAGQGIIVNGADGRTRALITGTKIEGNIVRSNASAGISNINNTDATIMGNTIEDNGLSNAGGNGIGIRAGFGFQGAATRVLVQDNQVRRNGQNGIVVLRNARENRIINNVSTDNNMLGHTERYRHLDLLDENDRCDENVWNGNVWGSGLYAPICVTNGGSGPRVPSGPEGTAPNRHMSLGCHDSFDNDEDGLVDGYDPDCKPPEGVEGPPGDPTCSDGLDNDGDYLIDGEDYDCGVVAGPGDGPGGPGDGPGGPGDGPGSGPGPGPGESVIP